MIFRDRPRQDQQSGGDPRHQGQRGVRPPQADEVIQGRPQQQPRGQEPSRAQRDRQAPPPPPHRDRQPRDRDQVETEEPGFTFTAVLLFLRLFDAQFLLSFLRIDSPLTNRRRHHIYPKVEEKNVETERRVIWSHLLHTDIMIGNLGMFDMNIVTKGRSWFSLTPCSFSPHTLAK